MVPFVTFFGGGKTGILPHGPQLAAVHIGLDAAGKRKCSRLLVVGSLLIFFCINSSYFNTGIGKYLLVFRRTNFTLARRNRRYFINFLAS